MRLSGRARIVGAVLVLSCPAIVGGLRLGESLRPAPVLRVTFLDVGQADATVIHTPSGRTILLDTGRGDAARSQGRGIVLPFLRSLGVHRLDAVVLSHWDQDHAGGAAVVLTTLATPRLLLPVLAPGRDAPTDTERRTLRAARHAGVGITHLARGQVIRTGDAVEMRVLHPPIRRPTKARTSDNSGSLVLGVIYGQRRILLMGDAERDSESAMLRSGADVQADVLKVGHHGSASSTSDRWLAAVRPSVAVISVGARNAFGHPDTEVVRRLSRRRVRVLRTDRSGAITLTTDGRSLDIATHGVR
jgi:competence protein ComEC